MNYTEAVDIYRNHIKPSFESGDYREVFDIFIKNPEIVDYLSEEELKTTLEKLNEAKKGLEKTMINLTEMILGVRN